MLAACGTASIGGPAVGAVSATAHALTVDGRARTYDVVAPAGAHGPLPMIMILHGRYVDPSIEEPRTGFLPLAQQGKAILVYPVGYDQSWNAGGCCGDAAADDVDDTAFLTATVGEVASHYPIDRSRVYLVGYSNGARMAFTEICAQPGVFAAFAVFAAAPTQTCRNTGVPVPVLISDGTADPELATTDPPRTATQVIDGVVTAWRARDGCSAASDNSAVPPARLTLWTDCRLGSAVESLLYNGLSHFWPSATQTNLPYSADVGQAAAGATLMWAFLDAHRTPTDA
jgi:polyhydroxybutyrate depolymerase